MSRDGKTRQDAIAWNNKIKNDAIFFENVVNLFGKDKQIEMMIEECSEMIQALQHYKRGRSGFDEVGYELADLIIMCEQFKHIIPTNFEHYYNEKLERLKVRYDRTLERKKEMVLSTKLYNAGFSENEIIDYINKHGVNGSGK